MELRAQIKRGIGKTSAFLLSQVPFPFIKIIPPRTPHITILCAHGVHNLQMSRKSAPPDRSILDTDFSESIEILMASGEIISLSEASDMLAGKRDWKRNAYVITFDDSLKSMRTIAAPILQKFGVSGTFYISTEVIDKKVWYWWDCLENFFRSNRVPSTIQFLDGMILETKDKNACLQRLKNALKELPSIQRDRLVAQIVNGEVFTSDANPHSEIMTWNDVRELRMRGMEIGSHSVTHANLKRLTGSELNSELMLSKERIGIMCEADCLHLAYPYGRHSPEAALAAKTIGYSSAVTTIHGSNRKETNPFLLKRCYFPKESHQIAGLIFKQRVGRHAASN